MTQRRFTPPWTVEETLACFVVKNAGGQKLAQRLNQLTRDEAGRNRQILQSFRIYRAAKMVRIPPRGEPVNVMGQKWTATLKVEFELQDGQPPHRAENVLRGAVAQFRLNMVTGHINGRIKPGSAKVEILGQGPVDTVGEG